MRVESMINKRVRTLGDNDQFVPDMENKLNETYPPEKLAGNDPICELLRKERDAAEAYLRTLGVVRAAATARNDG
jgi:hypothetical protein